MTNPTQNQPLANPTPSPALGPVPGPDTAPEAIRAARRAAVLAGAAILLIAALAGFGNLIVVEGMVTPGDATTTARDILGSEGLFRLGVASLYLAALVDVVVAWGLFLVFKSVHAEIARLSAWLRLAYAAVFMVALSQLVGIPALLNDTKSAHVFNHGQVQAQALAKVDAFHDIWFAALALFGAHLIGIGWLAYRSGFVPRLVGGLLLVAGAGYVLDSFVSVFVEDPSFHVSDVTFLGEFLLGLWLLVRSRRIAPTTMRSGS